MENKLARLVGMGIGIADKLSINLKAMYHGHYHQEDLVALEKANKLIYNQKNKINYNN